MSWVSEIRDICGDYAIEVKYSPDQAECITLIFNSLRNAETVKRCIEIDDSVPNVATAVDFVEVVRCKKCTHRVDYCGRIMCGKHSRRINDGITGLRATRPEHFCADGVKQHKEE